MLPWRVVDQLLHPRHRRRFVSNGKVVETLWCARAAVENATCALDAARLAAAYGGDTDTAAAIAAGVWCAAGVDLDPAAWELPHLGAPVPRWFRDVAKPVLVPAVPWERGGDEGRVLQ